MALMRLVNLVLPTVTKMIGPLLPLFAIDCAHSLVYAKERKRSTEVSFQSWSLVRALATLRESDERHVPNGSRKRVSEARGKIGKLETKLLSRNMYQTSGSSDQIHLTSTDLTSYTLTLSLPPVSYLKGDKKLSKSWTHFCLVEEVEGIINFSR
jgi:hypothetical protein